MARKTSKEITIDPKNLPYHIAIIMDGNGRWAKKRFMPSQAGHRAGMEALRRTVEAVSDLGVQVLTVYAFSTENWKRPADEVDGLMNLLLEYLATELRSLHEKGAKIKVLGDPSRLRPKIQQELKESVELTKNNTKLVFNIALNYGGRDELTRMVREIAGRVAAGELAPDDITESTIESYLYTWGNPDPDLLIRTAGEMRISNFLLWQIAYTELWVTEVLWPDFNRQTLLEAISHYQRRDRRYGGR